MSTDSKRSKKYTPTSKHVTPCRNRSSEEVNKSTHNSENIDDAITEFKDKLLNR